MTVVVVLASLIFQRQFYLKFFFLQCCGVKDRRHCNIIFSFFCEMFCIKLNTIVGYSNDLECYVYNCDIEDISEMLEIGYVQVREVMDLQASFAL